jgi:hypothetical protein
VHLKTLLLLAVALLAACASPTAVIDQRSFNCGPGQDLEIRAGLEDPLRGEAAALGQLTFLVEVANNGGADVTVKSITVEPRMRGDVEMRGVTRDFDQTVAEAEEQVFRLPATDFGTVIRGDATTLPRAFEFLVVVRLTNGDVYRCPFSAGQPR